MAKKPDTYEGAQEEWDEIMSHCEKVTRSLMNDFFDGEQAILSEQFYRWITKKPFLTKEEVQARTEKYIAKEKEIWDADPKL